MPFFALFLLCLKAEDGDAGEVLAGRGGCVHTKISLCYGLSRAFGTTMEREFTHYCDRCGQCLSWKYYKKAVIIRVTDGKIFGMFRRTYQKNLRLLLWFTRP